MLVANAALLLLTLKPCTVSNCMSTTTDSDLFGFVQYLHVNSCRLLRSFHTELAINLHLVKHCNFNHCFRDHDITAIVTVTVRIQYASHKYYPRSALTLAAANIHTFTHNGLDSG